MPKVRLAKTAPRERPVYVGTMSCTNVYPTAKIHHSRLADLNERLKGLLDELSRTKPAAECLVQPSRTINHSIDRTVGEATSAGPRLDIDGYASTPSGHQLFQTRNSPSGCRSWMTSLSLTPCLLDHLLEQYRGIQHFLPFVVIQDEWNAEWMLVERPFLLLAVVTVAAYRHPCLSRQLSKEFTETLARRVVLDGDNDLDLLQGMLVHLAWYIYVTLAKYTISDRPLGPATI